MKNHMTHFLRQRRSIFIAPFCTEELGCTVSVSRPSFIPTSRSDMTGRHMPYPDPLRYHEICPDILPFINRRFIVS